MTDSIICCTSVQQRMKSAGRVRYMEHRAVTLHAVQDKRGYMKWQLGISLDVWRINLKMAEDTAQLAAHNFGYPFLPGVRPGSKVTREHLTADRSPAPNANGNQF